MAEIPVETPLVRAFEVWVPNRSRSALRFTSGFYRGYATGPGDLDVEVAVGQGLPGQVLERRRPVILEDLTAFRGFLRPEVAAESGFSAGVGFPVLRRGVVRAVVTLLFATPEDAIGAYEIWTADAARQRLAWSDGYYGDLDAFGAVSRETTFAFGEGIPGQVAQSEGPVLFHSLTAEAGFVRSEVAAEAGLSAGLGLPISGADAVEQVVLLLTSSSTPLARVMEVWRPNGRGTLHLSAGYYGPLDGFAEVSRQTTFRTGVGLPGRVYQSKAPVVFERLTAEAGFVRSAAAARSGLQAALGVPVFHGGRVRAVVVLFN